MIAVSSPHTADLAAALVPYDFSSTVARVAALMTVPSLHATTLRLELLQHLAVASCGGSRKPTRGSLEAWLNTFLWRREIVSLEDPPEDVFVANIQTPEGNLRVFPGLWESTDYYLQATLDALLDSSESGSAGALTSSAIALLRLSDHVADRLDLTRWSIEESLPGTQVRLTHRMALGERADAVTFTDSDLSHLRITRSDLAPFVLSDRQSLWGARIDDSALCRQPIVSVDDRLILAMPSAVCPSIVMFIVRELRRTGSLLAFEAALTRSQAQELDVMAIRSLHADTLTPPPFEGESVSFHSQLLRYDGDKYIHAVLLHDHLGWFADQGLSAPLIYPERLRTNFVRHLQAVASMAQRSPGYRSGLTLVVMGGLGRSVAIDLNHGFPDDWATVSISLPDLLLVGDDISRPIEHFLKCMSHKTWAEQRGVAFHVPNGDFNLYSFWLRTNHQLIPRDMPIAERSVINLGPEFVRFTRQRIRPLADRHAVLTLQKTFARVIRFGLDAYFESKQRRPIYGSVSHVLAGQLAGVVETPRGASWLVTLARNDSPRHRALAHELWSDFLDLYAVIVREVEQRAHRVAAGVIQVSFDLRDIVIPEDDSVRNLPDGPRELQIVVDHENGTALVKCPASFLSLFSQPTNTGERTVVRGFAQALTLLHTESSEDVTEAILDALTDKALGPDARVFHVFPTTDAVDYLLNQRTSDEGDPSLAHEDFVLARMGLAYDCTDVPAGTTLRSKAECNALLNRIVVKLWHRLRDELRTLDRMETIRGLLAVHEEVIRDRELWKRTARALIALYQESDDVDEIARTRESERSNLALASRTLLEMAVCECPEAGGQPPSQWMRDQLLATTALLIEVATDSDAIHSELLEPAVTLWGNGDYTLDRAFYEAVIAPFHRAYFSEGFSAAADAYERLYRDSADISRRRLDSSLSPAYIDACRVELGISPDQVVESVGALMDLAVERQTVVVETTLPELRQRLAARGLPIEVATAFLSRFSLTHREAWDQPPPGFTTRDISPWRYSRRLSLIARPILIVRASDDGIVMYGLGTLRQGIAHVLDRTERGQMPADFFITEKMKAYLGAVSDQRGHAFAESVAVAMRSKGWSVRTTVKLTELGGTPDLGDIDVLAWNAAGDVRLIECKRLQLARTVAEIAEICRRFRGEAKDELAKHIRRTNWVKSNTPALSKTLGRPIESGRIDALVVTNTHVPMRYLRSLPIDANKIGPLPEHTTDTR